MEKVRLGIVGYGNQGSFYGSLIEQSYAPSMVVGAVCDIDEGKHAKIHENHPQVNIYTDYKKMIDSGEVDAVVTTLPHYQHPEVAMYALSKDIHVLNEKPAAVYTKQVKELNEFAARHEATYAIMFNQRNNPLYQKIKKIVADGEIGAIRRTNWIINTWYRPQAYYDLSDWRATWGAEGGGVLVNQAPHQLDLIQWIAGIPKSVYAKVQYGSHRNIPVEDDVTIVMDYGDGATGIFVTCTHDLNGTDRLEIDGDRGKMVVEDSSKATITRMKQSETDVNAGLTTEQVQRLFMGEMDVLGDDFLTTEVIKEESKWGEQHAGVLENFAQHILNGTELIAPGEEGINGVRLANATLLSDWLDREISLADFDDDLYLAELNKRIEAEGKYPTQA